MLKAAAIPTQYNSYLFAFVVAIGVSLVCYPLREMVSPTNIAMLFLLGVTIVATRLGRGAAILCAIVSIATFDVIFVPPRGSFAVADVQYLLTFAVMLIVGLTISSLTAGIKHEATLNARRERNTRVLYETARELSGALALPQVAATVTSVSAEFGITTVLLVPDHDDQLQRIDATSAVDIRHDAIPKWVDSTIARTVYLSGHRGGLDGPVSGSPRVHYLPLQAPTRTRGVLVARGDLDHDRIELLDALVSVCAIAIERLHFVEIAQSTEMKMESERLRNSLLTAVSHDLRTPLAGLVGLADTLLLPSIALPSSVAPIAESMRTQARYLSNMVSNLLELARLQTGRITLRREWQPLEEVIGASLRGLTLELAERDVTIKLAPDLPLVNIDAVLIERVLYNLLENAAKYSPAGSPLTVEAHCTADDVCVAVSDAGSGITAADASRVFEIFERGTSDSNVRGAGLGLALCRTIIEAHGGHLKLSSAPDEGARFEFSLPLGKPPSIDTEAGS